MHIAATKLKAIYGVNDHVELQQLLDTRFKGDRDALIRDLVARPGCGKKCQNELNEFWAEADEWTEQGAVLGQVSDEDLLDELKRRLLNL